MDTDLAEVIVMANKLYEETYIQNIANAIREKTGKTEPIMVSQMASEIGALKPLGTLDGLENGYDVMFYDENNEGLAFYSIKEGHSINPPVYNCKAWQTEDGASITFPYTPSADLIVYALNSTYADQLYDFYGVDSAVYPYLCLIAYKSSSSKSLRLIFGSSTDTYGRPSGSMMGTQVSLSSTEFSSITDLETLITLTQQKITSVSSLSSSIFNNSTDSVIACNYDNTYMTGNSFKYKWRLDE